MSKVEKLKAENEELRLEIEVCTDENDWLRENARYYRVRSSELEKDNARLREALEGILSSPMYTGTGAQRDKARAALKGEGI